MSASQRLVLMVPVFPQASETFIVSKAVGLARRGWDVHVVCDQLRPDLWPDFAELAGFEDRVHVRGSHDLGAARASLRRAAPYLRARGAGRGPYLRARGAGRVRGVAALARDGVLLELAPDLLHFEFGAIAVGRTYLADALGGVPLTVSFRGYDLAFVGLEDPHHYDDVFRRAAAVHCLGEDLWNRALARGCPPDKPHALIPPGVDLARFRQPTEPRGGVLGGADQPLQVLSVGRLEWKKGHQYGLRAIRRLVSDGLAVRWRIVGRGELSEAIAFERMLLDLGAEVEILGHLPFDQVVEQLRWADVLLHPSVSEGFGNAVLEAQAMQVPVVTSDADGLAENVEDGHTGFVVGRRQPEALAGALARLAHDGDLRVAMGLAGRRRVEEHFSLDAQLDRWEAFYADVLGRPATTAGGA